MCLKFKLFKGGILNLQISVLRFEGRWVYLKGGSGYGDHRSQGFS